MDGYITIGTKLQTDKFDKQISELENKIKKEEEKSQLKLKAKLQAERELENHKQKILEIETEYEKLSQKVERVQSIMERKSKGMSLTPQDFTDLQSYNQISSQYEKMGSQLDKMYTKQEQLNLKVDRTSSAYKDVNDKVSQYKQKIDTINLQKHQADLKQFKENFNGVGSSIQNAINKIGKLAIGVFGIRSAFSALKRASGDLASYNPQYSANLEYIRYALTQLIAPVLEYIVNLARTILAYINYIANAWFGVNLFANASAKSFTKVKQQLSGANKKAKELQKTITGFDEMNILNSNSTGGGGGIGGVVSPNFDLADLNAVEIPEWIKWIANNKDIVIGAITGIASAFLLFKTLQITGILGRVSEAMGGFMGSLSLLQKTFVALGIAVAIGGIITMISNLIKFFQDPTWSNFRGVLDGLSVALAGVATAMIAVNASNPLGWIMLALSAVTQLVKWIGDLVTNYDEEARMAEEVKKQEEALTEARNKLKDATDKYISAVDRAEEAEKKLKEAQSETGISIDDLLQKMDRENLTYKDLDENERKVYKAYINNKNAQDELKSSTEELSKANQQERDELYQLIAMYKNTSENAMQYRDKVVKAYFDGKMSAKEASEAIGIALGNMDENARKSFTEGLPDAIQKGLNPNNYTSQANSFKSWWESWLGQIKKSSSGVFNTIGDSINAILSAKGKISMDFNSYGYGFKTGGYVTKMATGGIINMPNKGVPVASAIAGEAGREGIVPLTDQQAMAQLGAEIGRNVLVNLTNITSMNGRVISRELKTMQGEQNFAYNS